MMLLILIYSYRDVQCLWTRASLRKNADNLDHPDHPDHPDQKEEGEEIEIPIVLIYSDNRRYLEGYRIPSFSRVLNHYFPHPYVLRRIFIIIIIYLFIYLSIYLFISK